MVKFACFSFLLALLLFGTLAAGCEKQNENASAKSESQDPVTLKVFQRGITIADDEFQKLYVEPVRKKYPNITMQLVRFQPGQNINDLLAAGDFPDLIYASSRAFSQYTQVNLPNDLNEFVKKNKFDLNKFDPVALEAIKGYGNAGQLFAMPLFEQLSVLYYNKDIFDKFGVAYPKDGMTWGDAITLAQKLTRTEEGVQYKGLSNSGINIRNFVSGLSVPFIDPKTQRAAFVTDGWKKAIQSYSELFSIPGNQVANDRDAFEKSKDLAMIANYTARLGELEELYNKGDKMNWDLAAYPSFKELPGKAMEIDVHMLAMSVGSKHKDDAFRVMALMTEADNQLGAIRNGRLSALKDASLKESFGADLASLKGKNVQAIFKTTPVVPPPPSDYTEIAVPHLQKAWASILAGKSDMNTALKAEEDAANKEIDAAKATK